MSEELAIQLQRLYRDYYANRLAFDDYRHRRGLLLDSLQDSYEPDAGSDITKPRGPVAATATAPRAAAPATPQRRGFRWYNVVLVSVVLVAALVFVVTRQLEEDTAAPATSAARQPATEPPAPPREEPARAAPAVAHPPDVGQELVEEFVARQDWRAMSVAEFQESWERLPEADRIVAKGAVWFEPLAKDLAYRIDEAAEFSGGTEDDTRLDRLYELSLHLGLVELVPPGWAPAPEPARQDRAPSAAGSGETTVADASVAATAEAPPADAAAAEEPDDAAPGGAAEDGGCTAAQLQTRRRTCVDVLRGGTEGPPMRVLPAGEFVMGSETVAEDAPVRAVSIARPFAISVFEITWADFSPYCRASGAPCPAQPWGEDDMPVVNVSWHDATGYAGWLSNETGQIYRLPTEEEWEYAARGGTTTEYPYGDKLLPAQARYSSITTYSSPLPTSDRTTQRNEFGLWHVVGNVREWVDADRPANPGGDESKVVRGGSYASDATELRSAARAYMPAAARDAQTGFRVLREL